ncbi:MAG: hypothetical protein FWG15_00685 [Propionibacteriaceae bacterium]|nr:hypothetical protein [Propionibacteriaceae bacterium]
MADYSDLVVATKVVVDPSTSGVDLALIAAAQPSLHAQIAAHPHIYPDLITWMGAQKPLSPPVQNVGATPSYVAPVGGGGAPTLATSPKKSRTGLLVGTLVTVVALIAAGIGLFLWQPWNSSPAVAPSESPTTESIRELPPVLTTEQYAFLLIDPGSVFYSDNPFAIIEGGDTPGRYSSPGDLIWDKANNKIFDICGGVQYVRPLPGCLHGIGMSEMGGSGLESYAVGAYLFSTPEEAREAARSSARDFGEMLRTDWGSAASVVSSENSGAYADNYIWYEIYSISAYNWSGHSGYMQYGNVMIQLESDIGTPWSDADAQRVATAFAQSVDVAFQQ